MVELKISEVISRERKRLDLTQEELAKALYVSPQAVSNWERGGYPDITLLPSIANFFGITVDELIGNDEVSVKSDIESFFEKYGKANYKERLSLAKAYHKKYPQNFEIMEVLGSSIVEIKDYWEKEYPLLKHICEKIMEECTNEWIRQSAIYYMNIVCPDEEFENWKYRSPRTFADCENEKLEERYYQRCDNEKYQAQSNANNLLSLMHFLGRDCMRFHDIREKDRFKLVFENPMRATELSKFKMRVLESISTDGEIPEAWLGAYAELCLKTGGALIGANKLDEGFEYLEKSFKLYEKWIEIPEGRLMDVGKPELFENAKVNKNDSSNVVYIHLQDGTKVWTPYLWLFWGLKNDIRRAMTHWHWFDNVRTDERFVVLYEKAQKLMEK